ncbi:asparagine synthase (glutamine-hydrolyzing) [Streptomyces sp. NBC_01431]|uniref:asparagine synthase (glutamine-hydrolyzing) n=1 Tax=Streptomyces sp. NBC_01431 TaxID=2903863 RepID=UPI002E365183|nr:asparagine synthase (glutamine-hydrolyzing) [Streptomyces sp. NBC_01431]
MSGITGWVDGGRDLRDEGPTAARMAAGIATRGRRGEGQWVGRHALLAQRTDAAWQGAVPPALYEENGRLLAVAVCDGELHNAEELWVAAGGGARPGDRSVADVILRAHLRWGERAAERFEGTFAFAVWDARTGELTLGRDRLGIKPLSYAPTPNGAVFASDVTSLVAHPMVRPVLDADALCSLLTQIRPAGHGALGGVREVPAGHTVRIVADRQSPRRYWGLEAREHTLGRDETVKQARDLLEDAVAREMRCADGAGLGVLLSGGLDSSVLTGLAATGGGRVPRTFTVMFGDTAAPVPDRPYAEEVVRFWGSEHQEVVVRPAELSDPATLAAVLAAKDYPTPFGDKNITPFLFSGQVARHVPVALSGEAADTVFGGPGGVITEGRELTTFPWIELSRKFGMDHGIGTGLFDGGLRRTLDVTGHLDRMFREAVAEVPHLPGAPAPDRLARQVDYLIVTRLLEQGVQHSERLAAAAGLQLRFPFADHRLFSYLYNVPPRLKYFDGREKSLLRVIARDLVPASVLTRTKVPYPITYDTRYKAALAGRLRTLLDDSAAPVRPLLDVLAAERIAENPRLLDRGGWLGRADVEMVLQLNDWAKRLNLSFSL